LFFLAEIGSNVLLEEVPNAALFSFWEENLQWYDRAEHFANFHLKFLTDLTFYLGVLPNTNAMGLPYFDLEAGVFVAMHNGHFLMSEAESLLLKFFLTHSMEEVSQLKMSREERNDLLEQLLNYYRWHLPAFKTPQSWEVLKSVL
jgi:recombination protein O C terminal